MVTKGSAEKNVRDVYMHFHELYKQRLLSRVVNESGVDQVAVSHILFLIKLT
jgi:hypothetical protein